MICPGVKRPPPMGSELEIGLLLGGVREFARKKAVAEFFAEQVLTVQSLLPRRWLHFQAESCPCPDRLLLHTRSRIFRSRKPEHRILRRTWETGILPSLRGQPRTSGGTARKCAPPGRPCHRRAPR